MRLFSDIYKLDKNQALLGGKLTSKPTSLNVILIFFLSRSLSEPRSASKGFLLGLEILGTGSRCMRYAGIESSG